MKFACYTLGCKVNQYETQAMEQLLVQSGHTLGSFDEICDGYIINTCTVTAVSDKKSRNAIRRVRKLNPQAVVGVCGCYAQSSPDEIRKLDVDVLIGTDGREAFVRHMIDAAQTRQKWDCVDDAGGPRAFEILPAGGLAARTRALLKVEDGCNNFCTYCIIPYARGRVRSMPLETAVAQATGLAAEGYREIVITGKKEAGFVVIPTILSLIMLVVMVMLFLAWNLPPIVIAVPVILELMSLSQILSLGLFYKVIIQKDGFYCRTNPFDGRYYRYSDILDWRLVESQRKIGSRYNRGRIRKTYYFYDLKFVDRAHQTHRLPYNKSLYEGEIDELVARIERTHDNEA